MQDLIQFLHRHWLLSYTFAIVIIALTIIEFIKQKRSATQVSPARLTQLINHQNAVVIDVRSATLFAEGHIIGSHSFPLSELKDANKKLEKLKIRPLIITCATGMDSPRAAALLANQGYNIHILAGGVRAWRDASMPVVKD